MSTSSAPSSATVAGTEEKLSHLLSSSQFTVAEYLNVALSDPKSSPETDELQSRMAELALHLQLQTQSCHEDIGRIGAELQAILPRCAADVGRVGVGLEGMRIDAQALLETTELTNEQELSSSLETLSTLHALQANLSRTKEVLKAAATWDSTLGSIPPLLAQQNLSEAVNALAQLENGERALRGMPNREEREESIAKVRQQVSVLLQPQLKHALSNMNSRLAPLQQCVALYTKLGKMDALQEEYVKNRPGSIHKAWFAFPPSYQSSTGIESSSASSTTKSDAFVSWLPSWYESVLSLLTEERRQSVNVFGAETAPKMVVKILQECFRPILPSFQSRLESLFSSSVSMPSSGSLESVCAVYQSTLRFLSLSYELVASAFLDIADPATGAKKDPGVTLYDDMMTVFFQVSAPFSNYQQRFDQLELKHSKIATELVSKDIQQAVGSVSSSLKINLATLQDATERLKDLAPFIFPMMEGSLDRFELLLNGYKAAEAIAAVDTILADHAGEVVIAIRTLSAAMTADANQLADSFDEQHVLCAMEVLKIAGSFKRDLRAFESKSRERMKMLTERMEAHLAREERIKETRKSTKAKSSFILPDSLSVVEIDSILTNTTCSDSSDEDGQSGSLSVLQRIAVTETERSAASLYPETVEAINRLANSCHAFVFDVCSAVPRKHLGDISSMKVWQKVEDSSSLDSYGTLPQQYITQVGEHMLALVQALEPFASDPEALGLANEVMEGVRDVALQAWSDFVAAAGLIGSDSVIGILMNGKNLAEFVLNNAALDEEDAALEEDAGEAEREIAAFCNLWLDLLGLDVTGRLLERIMRISQLTPKGCEHLSADLNYLVNVFSALGVAGHPHPLVSHLAELAKQSDGDLRAQISSRDRNNPVESALRAIEVRMALLRGIVVN